VQLTEQDDDIYVGVFRLVAGTLPVQCTSCNLWDLMPVFNRADIWKARWKTTVNFSVGLSCRTKYGRQTGSSSLAAKPTKFASSAGLNRSQ
jgi:hypothetical protein